MKTRIVHTKFWEDDYIAGLEPVQKLLFLYFITNTRVNIIHLYECADRYILLETGVSTDDLTRAKQLFEEDGKIFFKSGFVYLKNSHKYESYTGEKNEQAKKKAFNELPEEIKLWRSNIDRDTDTPIDTPIDRGSDSLRNHKSEIINHNSEIINKDGDFSKKKDEYVEREYFIAGESKPRKMTMKVGDLLSSYTIPQPTKKNGISTQWQEKAFRYADKLQIKLDKDFKSRWLRLFKEAANNKEKNRKLEQTFSYLIDYAHFHGMNNEGKIHYFFKLCATGVTPYKNNS